MEPTTTRPLLTSGSADPAVHELGRALAALGYENSVSQGLNPYGIVDESILQAVGQFRRDNDVTDDRQSIPGPVEEHARWIGPATWEAIEAAAADVEPELDVEPEPEPEPTPTGDAAARDAAAGTVTPPEQSPGDQPPADQRTETW